MGLGDLPKAFSKLPSRFIPNKSYWGFKYQVSPLKRREIVGNNVVHKFEKRGRGFYKVISSPTFQAAPEEEPSPEEVHRALSHINQAKLPKLKISSQNWVGPYKHQGAYFGEEEDKYLADPPPIRLKGEQIHLYHRELEGKSEDEYRTTIRHEIGHSLWENAPKEYRRKYERMYNRDDDIRPTPYSLKNVQEDFAESVSLYNPNYPFAPLRLAPEYESKTRRENEEERASRKRREKLISEYPGGLPNLYPKDLEAKVPKEYAAGEMKEEPSSGIRKWENAPKVELKFEKSTTVPSGKYEYYDITSGGKTVGKLAGVMEEDGTFDFRDIITDMSYETKGKDESRKGYGAAAVARVFDRPGVNAVTGFSEKSARQFWEKQGADEFAPGQQEFGIEREEWEATQIADKPLGEKGTPLYPKKVEKKVLEPEESSDYAGSSEEQDEELESLYGGDNDGND